LITFLKLTTPATAKVKASDKTTRPNVVASDAKRGTKANSIILYIVRFKKVYLLKQKIVVKSKTPFMYKINKKLSTK
jgi:hypothetical protein